MKIAINLQPLVSIFLILLSFSESSLALDNYKEYKRDHWDFDLASQYFYSEANYLSFGNNPTNLPSSNNYQLLDVTFETRYMPKPTWSVFAIANVGSAESNTPMAKRSNSSLNQAAAGFDFLMYSGYFQLVPEILLLMPFEHVSSTSDTVLNSEGVIELHTRLIAQKDFGTLRGYGWLGFNYRGDGRSFLAPYGLGMQLKFNKFQWGAEIFGYQSVSTDTKDNAALRLSYINGVNAGSMKFYSVEPSLVDSQLYMNWLMSKKWSLQLNGGATLTGSNAAAGFHVGGFLRYSFDMTEGYSHEEPSSIPANSEVPAYRSNMYLNDDLSSEKKVNHFKEDTNDGVDQLIFKPRPTSKPKVQDVDMQQQMDNTEFQVELRSQKKKKKSN